MKKVSDQLRQLIRDSDKAGEWTRYAICKKIGLDQSTMLRFMRDEGGLSTRMHDEICALLKLDLVRRAPKPRVHIKD